MLPADHSVLLYPGTQVAPRVPDEPLYMAIRTFTLPIPEIQILPRVEFPRTEGFHASLLIRLASTPPVATYSIARIRSISPVSPTITPHSTHGEAIVLMTLSLRHTVVSECSLA